MSHQFKLGDRVRVGPPTEDNKYGSDKYVGEGAIGIVKNITEDGCRVQFTPYDQLVADFAGDYLWYIDTRRLTLVDEKPVEPAAPLPIMARDMTLHDWFAEQALTGILAHPQSNELGIKGCIESAANAATAMMERRAK